MYGLRHYGALLQNTVIAVQWLTWDFRFFANKSIYIWCRKPDVVIRHPGYKSVFFIRVNGNHGSLNLFFKCPNRPYLLLSIWNIRFLTPWLLVIRAYTSPDDFYKIQIPLSIPYPLYQPYNNSLCIWTIPFHISNLNGMQNPIKCFYNVYMLPWCFNGFLQTILFLFSHVASFHCLPVKNEHHPLSPLSHP